MKECKWFVQTIVNYRDSGKEPEVIVNKYANEDSARRNYDNKNTSKYLKRTVLGVMVSLFEGDPDDSASIKLRERKGDIAVKVS